MELTKLYVLEIVNGKNAGKKHYFAKSTDRSYFFNCHAMNGYSYYEISTAKQYEIELD